MITFPSRRLSKQKNRRDDSPPSPPPEPGPSTEKRPKKPRDPDKKPRKDKFKPASEQIKPPRDKVKRNRSSDKSGDGKSSSSNKNRSKKTSKKKQNPKYTHAYAYSELQTRSSEDEIFGYKDTELKHEMTADLGWDPMTYYPNSSHKTYLPEPVKAKHIQMKNTSSPPLVVKSQDDEECKLDRY